MAAFFTIILQFCEATHSDNALDGYQFHMAVEATHVILFEILLPARFMSRLSSPEERSSVPGDGFFGVEDREFCVFD